MARTARSRIGPAIVGEVEPDALQPLRGIEIARPLPGGDGEVDLVVLRRDAHHFGAAPGDRAHIGVLLAVLLQHQALGGVDLGDRIGNFEVEDLRRLLQALGMLGAFEDLAAIGALALEHASSHNAGRASSTWSLASLHGTSLPSYQITPSSRS